MARINSYGKITVPDDNDVFIIDSSVGAAGTRCITWGAIKQLVALSGHTHPGSDITSKVGGAIRAEQDGSGNVLTATYFSVAVVDGRRIRLKKPNGGYVDLITQDTTYDIATSSTPGLVTAADKLHLDQLGIKVISDVYLDGHELKFKTWGGTNKAVLTLPDTTYELATKTTDGLMSKTDKSRLDDLALNQQSVVAITNSEIDSMFQ